MKALMLGWEFPPHIAGGLGTACLALTRALAEVGERVLFLVPHRFGDEPDAHLDLRGANDLVGAPGAAPRRRPRPRVIAASSPYAAPQDAWGGSGSTSPGAKSGEAARYGPDLFGDVARFGEAARALAAESEFDVVHAHDWMTFAAGESVARERGCPLVVHVHSLEQDRSPRGPNPRILDVERRGLSSAQAVVSVSRFTAERLRRFHGVQDARLRVVHNALPDGAAPVSAAGRAPVPERLLREPVVLYLGRVTAQKGPELFLEAARRVVRVLPRVKFVVAGDGDLYRSIVERTAELGLARHVAFTGFLSAGDVERAYAAADLFVLPSVAEPFGLTALEAASRGVPVVLTRQSGACEVLPSALQVDWWDVEGLAERILAVLSDPALHARLSAAGRREAAALLWRRAAERIAELYRDLLTGAPA